MSTYQPHEYQKRATKFILDNERCALWMEMGLGKTVATATAIEELFAAMEVERVLIVAPLRVATSTWPSELEKWDHLGWLPWRVLRGNERDRRVALRRDWWGIDLINYDLLKWLFDTMKGRTWPWDMVVFDESSKLKSTRTERWKRLRPRIDDLGRVVELTGSPASNGLLDVWAPIRILSPDALGTRFQAYKDRWFESDYMGWRYVPRAGAEKQIREAVRPHVVSMRACDYLKMPDLIVNDIEVELPAKVRGQYEEMERELVLELEKGDAFASNAAGLLNKCLQICNGAIYVGEPDDPARTWEELHTAKLDALDEVVEEMEGEPLLVPYLFRHDALRILRRNPPAVWFSGDRSVEDWNSRKFRMMVGHPLSMGHGLNLQDGGHTMAWFGLPWSLEQYEQTVARLHRQGQTKPVIVHRIVTTDTVEDDVRQALEEKRTVQEVLKENLR